MINLVFKEGNKHVDPVWEKRPEFIQGCKSWLDSKVSHLACPTHRSGSRATLLIDVRPGLESWEVVDYCCERIRTAIAEKMPYPSNYPAATRHIDRAA